MGSCGSGFHPAALDRPDPAGFGHARTGAAVAGGREIGSERAIGFGWAPVTTS
jgi:hypothetical protein